ncbi:MAG: hypothetical protein ACRDIY_02185 [Chloroflexota bacterium]
MAKGRFVGGLSAIGLLIVIVVSAGFVLASPDAVAPGLLPDPIAYQTHAALGTALNLLGASPSAAGVQWLKAASHARTDDEVAEAARGIVAARTRSPDPEALDASLCRIVEHGSPAVWAVASQARLAC